MSLAGTVCYNLAKQIVLRRKTGDAGENPHTFDLDRYQQWRNDELRGQYTEYFTFDEIAGKDVLDFGCGGGTLSLLLARQGVKSITGVDLNPLMIEQAHGELHSLNGNMPPVMPRFMLGQDPKKIEFPDASFDIVLCFDVLEHIMDYREIIREWKRVLRPGGRVFIWWVPWFHPYGPHLENLVPLPWAHVFFSDKTLIEAAARVYDLPEYKPRWWDLDSNGGKRPNKWWKTESFPDLNKLTIREFEELCDKVGLQIATRQIVGFGGSLVSRMTRGLSKLPLTREIFCSRIIYRLQK